jgi:hypothetical protein
LDWLVISDQKLPNWVWPTLYLETRADLLKTDRSSAGQKSLAYENAPPTPHKNKGMLLFRKWRDRRGGGAEKLKININQT